MTTENWYLKNKTRIMREVKFAIPHYKKFVAEAYGMDVAEAVFSKTIQRFEALLPDIPYIGGDENILTENLYLSAAMLAMYQSLKAQGKSIEETARLIYLGTSKFYNSFPFRLLLRWQGRGRRESINAKRMLLSASNAVSRAIGSSRLLKETGFPSSLAWTTPNAALSNT